MKDKSIVEIGISFLLLVFLIALLNPLNFGMPPPVQTTMMIVFGALFLVSIGFVWQENTADERERLHRFIAGRFAYIVGTAVLVTGVLVQSLSHTLDIWLVAALALMIIAKMIGIIYSRSRH